MASSVLIVDDQESIRRAVADILADEGYTPASAASVDEALQRIEQQVPDLVLLDVAMPARDGIELLEELRRFCPELPVIMMSGHGTI